MHVCTYASLLLCNAAYSAVFCNFGGVGISWCHTLGAASRNRQEIRANVSNCDVLKVIKVGPWAIAICEKLMGEYNIGGFLMYQSLRQ